MRQLYLALAACVAALPAYAQAPTPNQSPTPGAQKASPATQQFVTKAAIGDLYEIESSSMVHDKSPGGEFENFAQRIVDDHTKSSEQLKSLAQKAGIEVPSDMDAKHQEMMDKLQSASGGEFAKLYRSQQIDAHKEAVDLYQQYGQSGDNMDIRQFAESTLPALKEHLQMAESLPQEPAMTTAQAGGQNMQHKSAEGGKTMIIGTLGPEHILASDLEDTDVYNAAGEEIGEVEDVVLTKKGEAMALVVSVGGFLGLGEKNVAIPVTAVEITADPNRGITGTDEEQAKTEPGEPTRIVLHGLSREQLEAAPSFESKNTERQGAP